MKERTKQKIMNGDISIFKERGVRIKSNQSFSKISLGKMNRIDEAISYKRKLEKNGKAPNGCLWGKSGRIFAIYGEKPVIERIEGKKVATICTFPGSAGDRATLYRIEL